jgi:hypothetical protein
MISAAIWAPETSPLMARWPKQHRLINQLRDLLRKEFGCQDAWVIISAGRCRLEVRVGGRRVVLLEDDEDAFWSRFYHPVERERLHLGERVVTSEPWRKTVPDLAAVLTPYWTARVGPRSSA